MDIGHGKYSIVLVKLRSREMKCGGVDCASREKKDKEQMGELWPVVITSTIHATKGLERPVVFVARWTHYVHGELRPVGCSAIALPSDAGVVERRMLHDFQDSVSLRSRRHKSERRWKPGGDQAFTESSARPAQRTADDVAQLVAFLSEQPFFTGLSPSSLELLSTCMGLQYAAPGEVVLHVGELTDRMYVLLSGSCWVVRHSRREGFEPQPPQQLMPGQAVGLLCLYPMPTFALTLLCPTRPQALCEAALVVSGRRSDSAVTVEATPFPSALAAAVGGAEDEGAGTSGETGQEASGGGGEERGSSSCGGKRNGGAALLVMTRVAWNDMCARAPSKRTLEQSEDLAALLRLVLPGLCSASSGPVLRAMSESAFLRHLPPGTIMFEEATRAEAQFLVLAGGVEMHLRHRRQGAANRAALRSALRSAVAAARGRSARGNAKGGGDAQPKSIRQKIEEERRARAQIKQSLALQREGLRTPKAHSSRVSGARQVEEEFKKWMLEFLSRVGLCEKRSGDTATAGDGDGGSSTGGRSRTGLSRTVSIKAANAWRRAAAKALAAGGDDDDHGVRPSIDRKDTTLLEYERRKMEEAGGLKDVGNMLGGAAARKAYMRGLAAKDGGMYEDDDPQEEEGRHTGAGLATQASRKAGGVHWDTQQEPGRDNKAGEEEPDVDVDEEEEGDPYIDAVEKVMGIAKQESGSADNGKMSTGSSAVAGQGGSGSGVGGGGGDPDADAEDQRTAEDVDLLQLNGGDDAATAGGVGTSTSGSAASGPGPDDVVDDACEEHLEQLYGPCGGRVEVGQVAGELPAMLLDRSKRGGAQRTRRAHSAIAGPLGADVLVVALDALRRGHEAVRDDLVSERLAVLTSLEPLRGLSDEHQAQLALGATVVSLGGNQVVVRQGQDVDALFVVLEGEVRLLDDPDITPSAPPPPQQSQQPSAAMAAGAGASTSGATATSCGAGAGTAATAPDSPFRSATAAAGGGKLMSIKIRRAAAALAALTLLGPGGSFGENVLGYPEDVAAAAAKAESWEDNGAEAAVPTSQYLATAMTSRPTKLLVMPRSLLLKYGYLRSSLPPFAQLRREAINGRRKQLRAGVQNRPAAAATGSSATTTVAPAAVSSGNVGSTAAAAAGTAVQSAGAMALGSFQTPRPPPLRPSEVLEQLGFKPVLRRMYNAGAKIGTSGGGSSGSGPNSAAAIASGGTARTPNPAAASAGSVSSSNGNSGTGSGIGVPNPLPSPLPHPLSNGLAATTAAAAVGVDRQHRRDLLAASALAANNPQSLSNAIARARGEDISSLPVVIHSFTAAAAAAQSGYRATADGASTASELAVPSVNVGLALPTPFSSSAAARMRPLRLSVSGVGTFVADSNTPSPIRRSSLSGGMLVNGSVGGGGGGSSGGVSIPALASPSPLRGSGGTVRTPSSSTSAPNPHVASVQLPRLSVAGNSSSGSVTPLTAGGGSGNGRALARPSLPGEPFLARLEAVEASPKSCSPQASGPSQNPGRSASSGSIGGGGSGGGGAAVTLLGQRSGGYQPVARA
ncbi:hypothetical protein VOLCADRAFT_92391 [Volvox carteri f. nagariensis]|uniref:Cyclic nucleotide-binding domain-containing protein n=1 Tax=Volvox carteri f. nagariensis TaxID=3068 RepID=D8TZJ3_VOLCA|nr:uncharacterized protein VOLCADRAFT_92391 [Volvox carteri f. nagariensis]EFJ47193.1 hypothetical protein VOLCADRAFT_92391 [Volvox carteri f. nagariensis]|eukprot:XP_002951742.1 hypothetical protein VOLCADRAFT_92391 [Volvox carteri f. nagariensis]